MKRKIIFKTILFLFVIILGIDSGSLNILGRYFPAQSLSVRRIKEIFHVLKLIDVEEIAMHEIAEGVCVSDGFARCGTTTYVAVLEPGKELELSMPEKGFIVAALGTAFVDGEEIAQGKSIGAEDLSDETVMLKAGFKGAIILISKPDLNWWQSPRLKDEVISGSPIEATSLYWQPFRGVEGLHNWSGQIKLTLQIGDVKGEVRINDWFLEEPEEKESERSAGIHDHSPQWWVSDSEQGYVPTVEFHFGLGNPNRPEGIIGYMAEYEEQGGKYAEVNRIPVYYGTTHPLFCEFLEDGTLKYPPHAWVTIGKDNEIPSFWGVVEVSASLWNKCGKN